MIKEQIIHLATILLVLSGLFLRATFNVGLTLTVAWLLGHFFPAVAREWGMPCTTMFECLQESVAGLPHNVLGQWWPVIPVVIGVAILIRPRRSK